jgi:signal transduction histidine kinase
MGTSPVETENASRARILVAEDDAGVRELVVRRLEAAGYAVRTAASGAEALAALEAEPPDLLLLDYILGDMTALAVLEALVESGGAPAFVVTTGQGSEDIAVDIMKRGARDYLVKDTAFLERLPEKVRTVLQQIETERRLAELEQKVRRAEQLETLARVTGGIAHEFHNLLAVIKNAAWLLTEGHSDDADVGRYAGEIDRNAERAAALTSRLLAFAEEPAGQTEPVEVGGLLGEVAALLEQAAGGGITVAVEAPAGGAHVAGELGRLRETLLDLGRNACEAMPEGGRLRFTATPVTLGPAEAEDLAPGAYLRIEVRDTGTGMDAATRARAFEPFFTTRSSGAAVGGNVGLGLSCAHGCIGAAGGAIRLESEPGAGTTVRILLPLIEAAVAAT